MVYRELWVSDHVEDFAWLADLWWRTLRNWRIEAFSATWRRFCLLRRTWETCWWLFGIRGTIQRPGPGPKTPGTARPPHNSD